VTEAELLAALSAEDAPERVLVWRRELGSWTPARDVPEIASRLGTSSPAEADWFLVSLLKLIVMSLATFGLYEIYWAWHHWKRVRERTGEDIQPFARGLFGVFFCYSLFGRIKEHATERGVPPAWTPGGMALAFIVLTVLARLPDPFWLLSFLSVVPLVLVQRTANAVCLASTPRADPNRSFSIANWVGVVFGGLLVLLSVAASFLPQEP
jgi:hypothetical protein